MHILVTSHDADESHRVVSALRDAGHDARAEGGFAWVDALAQHTLVILGIDAPDDALLRRVGEARARTDTPGPLLLLADALPDDFAAAAYEAGVDGEIRRPYTDRYLLARVTAALRRAPAPPRSSPPPGGARSLAPLAHTGPANDIDLMAPPLERVAASGTWRNARLTLQRATSAFLTLPVALEELPSEAPRCALAKAIRLSSVTHQLTARAALALDDAGAAALARHLFGDEADDLVNDMLSELANIFMGTLKTSFSTDALPFTGGLPEPIDVSGVLQPPETFRLQDAFALAAGDARITVHLGVRPKLALLRLPDELDEGMVLAGDVYNAKGMRVAVSGTRLTVTMIHKLRTLLPGFQDVEVMAP